MKKILLLPIIGGAVLLAAPLTAATVLCVVNTSKATEETHEVVLIESFVNFDIDVDVSDIEYVATTDGSKKVVLVENEKEHHEVKVEENTLKISYKDERKWYEKLRFKGPDFKVTLYIPGGAYENLKVKNDTGKLAISQDFSFKTLDVECDTGNMVLACGVSETYKCVVTTGNIQISDTKPASLEISSSTGNVRLDNVEVAESIKLTTSTGGQTLKNVKAKNIENTSSTGKQTFENVQVQETLELKSSTGLKTLTDVSCKNYKEEGSTGKCVLTRLIAEESINIKHSTGDVGFDHSDAATLVVETSTGDVEGSILTPKVIFFDSDTGKGSFPHSTTGGVFEIKTNTGNANITFVNE